MKRQNNKQFEVKIYSTGYCTYQVKAKDKNAAVIKARNLPIKQKEILSNLENWHEADEAETVNISSK